MTKLTRNTGINVSGSIKALDTGESLTFPRSVLENTLRTSAVRIKNATGMTYKVNRQSNGTHIVTRIA
jgi:hypothetical protein